MINNMIKECEFNQTSETSVPPLDYGIDYGGPLPEDQAGTMCIPETLCPIHDDDLDHFMDQVDTTSYFEDSGIQHFIECKHLLCTLVE